MRTLPIGIGPDGSFILDTGGTTITIPATLAGIKLLTRILSEPAGRLSEPGAPSQWDVKRELARASAARRAQLLSFEEILEAIE